VQIRPAADDDATSIGRIMYEAFQSHAEAHGILSDLPTADVALGVARVYVADPTVYSVVAEIDGVVVGSNFMLERDAIRTIGPTSVDGRFQGRGVGRALMEATVERAAGEDVRLVQDASNVGSLGLYASLGFEVKEPLLLVCGQASGQTQSPGAVRRMSIGDLPACNALCQKVHGFDRGSELVSAVYLHEAFVRVRDGRIIAYVSAADSWQLNHGVAETTDDLQALIAGLSALRGDELAFYLPTRNGPLLRWCLAAGFQGLKTATLMAKGGYKEPHGAFLPSANY
jgi:ribosomal protein S18 acetylase RimI-like enzyme